MRDLLSLLLFTTVSVSALRDDTASIVGPRVVNPPGAAFIARASSAAGLDPCQALLANVTDVSTLAMHEYASLEQCLYYELAGRAARSMRGLGIPHPIATVPPSYVSRQPVKITFKQITLQHFELNEYLKDIAVHGYLEVGWSDDRLTWNKDTWKVDKLTIQSLNHVWIPVFGTQTIETELKNGDAFEMRKVETSEKGNVSALAAFSLRTFCDDSDFENYPDDVYRCCFNIEPHVNQEVIEFSASGLPVFTDPKHFRDYGWKVSGSVPQSLEDPTQVAQLGFCLNLQRASGSIRVELTVPLLVCSVLFLITPFLGMIKVQICVKFLVMALQFVTFTIFANRIAPHHGSAAATPKLLRFLEFSVLVNCFSIAASVLLWAAARVKRDLPPWGQLIQISNFVNRFVCVLQSHAVDKEQAEVEKGEAGQYQRDWTLAFVAIHSLAMAVFSLVFVLGWIVLL